MPPGDGLAVTPDDLVNHAGRVEAVAADMATAVQAGAAARPGPEAYGKLCVIVPVLLGELQDMVVDGMQQAERSLRDTADRLRQTAAGYRDADERSATAVRRAGSLP